MYKYRNEIIIKQKKPICNNKDSLHIEKTPINMYNKQNNAYCDVFVMGVYKQIHDLNKNEQTQIRWEISGAPEPKLNGLQSNC